MGSGTKLATGSTNRFDRKQSTSNARLAALELDPPSVVLQLLNEDNLNHRPVLLKTCTDVDLSGNADEQWLIVTADHVNLVSIQAHKVVQSVDLKTAEQFRTQAGVGSGLLQVKRDGHWYDVARYSNALADRFFKVSAKLEQLRQNGKLEIFPEDEVDAHRCPECHLRLPVAGETCPRCLPRGAIMTWAWEIIKPHWKATLIVGLLTVFGVAAELVPPQTSAIHGRQHPQ